MCWQAAHPRGMLARMIDFELTQKRIAELLTIRV